MSINTLKVLFCTLLITSMSCTVFAMESGNGDEQGNEKKSAYQQLEEIRGKRIAYFAKKKEQEQKEAENSSIIEEAQEEPITGQEGKEEVIDNSSSIIYNEEATKELIELVETYIINEEKSEKIDNLEERVKALIGSGANINAHYCDDHWVKYRTIDQNITLLHRAAMYCNIPVLQLLLDNGADINVITPAGNNLLHYAAFWIIGNRRTTESELAMTDLHDLINYVIVRGISIDAINNHGFSPLAIILYSHGYHPTHVLKIIDLLLEHGAPLHMDAEKSLFALCVAAGNDDIIHGTSKEFNPFLFTLIARNLLKQFDWAQKDYGKYIENLCLMTMLGDLSSCYDVIPYLHVIMIESLITDNAPISLIDNVLQQIVHERGKGLLSYFRSGSLYTDLCQILIMAAKNKQIHEFNVILKHVLAMIVHENADENNKIITHNIQELITIIDDYLAPEHAEAAIKIVQDHIYTAYQDILDILLSNRIITVENTRWFGLVRNVQELPVRAIPVEVLMMIISFLCTKP